MVRQKMRDRVRTPKKLPVHSRKPVRANGSIGTPVEEPGAFSKRDWQMAELLADRNRLFSLWLVSRGTCTTRSDFPANYTGVDFDPLVSDLVENGFLSETASGRLRVTTTGRLVLDQFGDEAKPTPNPDTKRRGARRPVGAL